MHRPKYIFLEGVSHCEFRLVWQHAGGAPSAPREEDFGEDLTQKSFQEKIEKMRPLVEQVEAALIDASRGNNAYERLTADAETMRAMQSLVEYFEGMGVRWYTHQSQLDQESLPKLASIPAELDELGRRAHSAVVKYFDALKEHKVHAMELMRTTALKESEVFGSIRNIQRVLDNIPSDVDSIGIRQRVVIDIARELVAASRQNLDAAQAKKFVNDLFNDDTRLSVKNRPLVAGLEAKLLAAITKHVPAGAKLDALQLQPLLKILQEEADIPPEEVTLLRTTILPELLQSLQAHFIVGEVPARYITSVQNFFMSLTDDEKKELVAEPAQLHREVNELLKAFDISAASPERKESYDRLVALVQTMLLDRTSLRYADRDLQSRLIDDQSKRARLIVERFPERARYLYLLAGGHPDAVIRRFIREDSILDLETMQVYLQQLKPEGVIVPTVAELYMKADFLNQIDAAKVTKLSAATKVSADALKNACTGLLRVGAFQLDVGIIKVLFSGGGIQEMEDAVVWLYGADIAKRLKEEASAQTVDAYDAFLKNNLPHLVIREEAQAQLVDLWDQTVFQEYLRKDVKLDNPVIVDVGEALRRKSLPDAFGTYLEDNELNISLSAITAIAQFDTFDTAVAPITIAAIPDLASQIIDLAVDPGSHKVDKDELDDILSFLVAKGTLATTDVMDPANGFVTERGGDFYLVDAKRADLVTTLEALSIPAAVVAHMKSLRASQLHTLKGVEKFKLTMREAMRLAKKGGGSWWDWMSSMPRIFRDATVAERQALQEMIDKEKATGEFRDLVGDVLTHFTSQDSGLDATFKALGDQDLAKHESLLLLTQIIPLSKDPKESLRMRNAALTFLAKQERIKRELAPWMEHEKDETKRLTAMFLANQGDARTSIDRARQYLQDPAAFVFTPDEQKGLERFLNKNRRVDMVEGRDILLPLRTELGVDIFEKALVELEHAKRKDNKGAFIGGVLLEGDTHFDNWLNEPEKARQSLSIILFDVPGSTLGGKDALIQAFCDRKEVTLPNGRILRFGDAQLYVAAIQDHLQRQRGDFAASKSILDRRERFTQPLDVLRAGAESVGNMLRSGDRVQQGIAMVMITSAGYALLSAWKETNPFYKGARAVILGLPLLFGADFIINNMTSKGLLQRLGLTYMNAEDQGAAIEQFIRRHEKKTEYKDLGSAAGFEAMQQLMHPDKPVPIHALLEWRKQARKGTPDSKFSDGAPAQVRAAMSRVRAKLGTMEGVMATGKGREQHAYKILLQSFEALCVDVAEQNAKKPATVEDGMKIIQERYVDFTAEHLVASGFADDFRWAAGKRPGGGFSMLDILVYEIPTPAMRKELLENPTFLEWTFRGWGKDAIVWAREEIRKGVSLVNIYRKHAMESAPEVIDAAKEKFTELTDYLRRTGVKLLPELQEEIGAMYQVLKNLGIIIKDDGSKLVFSLGGKAADVGAAGVEKLRKSYGWLKTVPALHMLLQPMEDLLLSVEELDTLAAKKQIGIEFEAIVSFYSSGTYPMEDGTGRYSVTDRFSPKRTEKIVFTGATGAPLTPGETRRQLVVWRSDFGNRLFGAAYDILSPSQQRFTLEVLQANFFDKVAKNAQISAEMNRFQAEIATLRRNVEASQRQLRQAEKDHRANPTIGTDAAIRAATMKLKNDTRRLTDTEEKGTRVIEIPFMSLATGRSLNILANSVVVRDSGLFVNVKDQDRTLLGIPANWLLGDAKEELDNNIKAWKSRRLQHDIAYQRSRSDGIEPEIIASYERYLEHVALNEVFLRAMLATPGGGPEEAQNILRISMEEARHAHLFLQEREGLVSYAKFREVWNKVAADPAKKVNLP